MRWTTYIRRHQFFPLAEMERPSQVPISTHALSHTHTKHAFKLTHSLTNNDILKHQQVE